MNHLEVDSVVKLGSLRRLRLKESKIQSYLLLLDYCQQISCDNNLREASAKNTAALQDSLRDEWSNIWTDYVISTFRRAGAAGMAWRLYHQATYNSFGLQHPYN